MLTLFRKIRKNLTGSSSIRKLVPNKIEGYFLYAIGEIALVVIGILIALQINNWNEWRKDRITEKEILSELKENLELNVKKLESQIVRKRDSDFSSQVLLTAIENKQPYQDSLENHFGWGLSYEDPGPLSKAGYESFKNIGMDILRNKELKRDIIFLFEDTYAQSETRIARLMGSVSELVRLRQEYLMRKTGFNFVPFDYEKLIRDEHFHSWVVTIKNSRGWGRIAMEESLEETKRVLLLIEGELKF